MDGFKIIPYRKPNGEEPATVFLDSLDGQKRAKMDRVMMMLAEHGHELRRPYSAPVKDGLFEMRLRLGNNIGRVIYFYASGKRCIMTHGFMKKDQKLPLDEIERAIRYKADWEAREKERTDRENGQDQVRSGKNRQCRVRYHGRKNGGQGLQR